ncbi:MAG TPA: Uma2 family endonuclease [Dehalococcoidia bacterium]|nr:Uma2 family endonuclease [Dehalococcoidia bacterium]
MPQPRRTSAKRGSLPARRLFTIEEYQRMGEAGILSEDERVELWEGEIVCMAPIGSDHAGSTDDFANFFAHALHGRAIVRVQNPIDIPPRGEPQPDIAVLRPRPDRYHASHPTPEDVLLLIEVADTSLRYDRDVKLAGYASARIPEVWIADLRNKRLLVFRNPRGSRYTEERVLGKDEQVSPLAFPDVTLRLAEIFT